jgi:hypothetical protein
MPTTATTFSLNLTGKYARRTSFAGSTAPTDSASATGWNPAVTVPSAAAVKSGVDAPRSPAGSAVSDRRTVPSGSRTSIA